MTNSQHKCVQPFKRIREKHCSGHSTGPVMHSNSVTSKIATEQKKLLIFFFSKIPRTKLSKLTTAQLTPAKCIKVGKKKEKHSTAHAYSGLIWIQDYKRWYWTAKLFGIEQIVSAFLMSVLYIAHRCDGRTSDVFTETTWRICYHRSSK